MSGILGGDLNSARETTGQAQTLGPSLSPIRRQAIFETTKRLLAAAVSEGLAIATIETSASRSLLLRSPNPRPIAGYEDTWIKCGIRDGAYIENDGLKALGWVRADDLLAPVLTRSTTGEISEELHPGVICRIICSWHPQLPQNGVESVVKEVQNGAANQVKWLEIAATLPELHLKSSLSDWEQSNVFGSPIHPLHRTCLAQSPMKPITPDDIPELRAPELSFLSIPRSELRVTGPFEQLLEPLLESLGIPKEPEQHDCIVVPCFTRQLPSIMPLFPQARHIRSVQDCCRAQTSMRTISLLPEINFPFHLKMSLNCQITSCNRNVTPWTALMSPVLSKILPNLVPSDLWMFEEPASITGAHDDVAKAGNLSCIIRKFPEQHAKASEEVLVPTTGLYQTPFNDDRTYMEIFFGLDDLKKKQEWFRKYLGLLLPSIMGPYVQHGIGFESHLQNTIVRVNVTTKEVTGFAIRDFDGTRIYYPKFRRAGYELSSGWLPGDRHITDNPRALLHHMHKTLIQENVSHLLYMLGLEPHGGWSIVRDELERALDPSADHDGKIMYDFFLKETMHIYPRLRMRLLQRPVEDSEVELPNLLLREI